jgi:hypothetical protein
MRHLVPCLVLLAVAGGTSTSFAGPPLDGSYQSTDLGGVISVGRYTEGWAAGGGALNPGTTHNAESWNGSTLGTEWRYWCGTEMTAGVLLVDNVNALGNGNRTYMKTFIGGYIWLSGAGPWANGDADYPGFIDNYSEFETIQYLNWVPVGAVTNVQAIAHFTNYPSACMTFYVSNGTRIGTTDLGGVKPPDYPDFLAAGTCAPTLTLGAWWNMNSMTLTIAGCQVPVEKTTWGTLKSSYR